MKEKRSIPTMTFLRDEICDKCKRPYGVYEIEIAGGPNKGEKAEVKGYYKNEQGEIEKGCICEDIALAEQTMETWHKKEKRKTDELFSAHSLINKRLKDATIESYLPKNKTQEKAKRSAERYIEIFSLDNPINVVFTGSYGVGKSHLAKAIADGVMAKSNPKTHKHYSAIFISLPKLFRKISSTYNKDSKVNQEDIYHLLETVDLLVLDDLGTEKQNEWRDERIFDLIDSRQGMHTIYTSNYNERDLFDLLGERNFSRIVNEDTKIIEIEGSNYRLNDVEVQGEEYGS